MFKYESCFWMFWFAALGFGLGSGCGYKMAQREYREKEKEGLVEYYDELNQRWLWKKRKTNE